MKITDKRKDPIVYFNTLDIGDVFLIAGALYLKIQPVEISGDYPRNAFNLETGYLYYFDEQDEVNVVNAELVIKD